MTEIMAVTERVMNVMAMKTFKRQKDSQCCSRDAVENSNDNRNRDVKPDRD